MCTGFGLSADYAEMWPRPIIDAWLLKRFPGRFLEEIEAVVDWGRLMRVVEVEAIYEVERWRDRSLDGSTKHEDIPSDVWERIAEHERLIEQYG